MNHKTTQTQHMELTDLLNRRRSLSKSWIKAAGLLKGKKKLDPLAYQKKIRKEWARRFNKLTR